MSQDTSNSNIYESLQSAHNPEDASLKTHSSLSTLGNAASFESSSMSEAEMASVIAKAVEASFQQKPQKEPVVSHQKSKKAERKEPVLRTPPTPAASTAPTNSKHSAETPVSRKKYEKPVPDTSIQNTLPYSSVSSPPAASAAQQPISPPSAPPKRGGIAVLFHVIRARQRKDLPSLGISLKAAEKRQTLTLRISGALSPVRYIILLLMSLSLGGRKFSWMLLGFLGGETGLIFTLVLTIAAMAVSYQCLARALKDIFYLRFSFDSLLLVATVIGIADAAFSKNTETLLPLAAIGWCLTGIAALITTRGKLRSLRTVIGGKNRTAIRISTGKWDDMDCIGKAASSTSGFVRHLEERDTWLTVWTFYSIFLLILCLILSAWLTSRTSYGYLHLLAALLLTSLPVSGVLCCARPFQLLSRALHSSAALSGWFGIRMLSGRKAALIYDKDLFPRGYITHKGVKIYGSQTPQLLVSYGASLILRGNSVLREPFINLLQDTGGEIFDVKYFQATEGGLTGRINGVFVAIGTYNFMQLMGILPPESAARSGLFIAVGGEIAGLFAMKYHVKNDASAAFRKMVRDRRLSLLIATQNLCVNPSFLERWFHVSVTDLICPKADTRWELSKPSLLSGGTTCGYVLSDGIGLYSRMVVGARRCCRTGRFFTVLSILLSIGLLLLTLYNYLTGSGEIGGAQLLLLEIILCILIEFAARISAR